MKDFPGPGRLQNITQHVAFRALFKSVLINMIAPALLYHLAEPHFAAKSLWPLAISGCPPIIWLVYGAIKFGAVDFLGLFAAENVADRIAALLLAHSEQGALIGRTLETSYWRQFSWPRSLSQNR
jgi:hypothetical protein